MDTGVMTDIATYQTATTKVPAVTSLSGSDSAQETSTKLLKDEKTPKRPSAKKRKCSETKQRDLSALDCSDYWLRFDSDNESLYHAGAEQSSQDKSEARASSVGTTGTFNLAFQSPSDHSVDDSALEHALSDEEELFSMALADGMKTESPSSGIEAPERLYSTPLSWERPQLGVQQMDPYMSTNSPSYNEPQDRQRLLAIAMGSGQTPSQLNTNQPTAMDFRFDMNQSPTTMSDRRSDEPEPKRAPTKPRMPSRTNSGGIGDRSKDKPKSSDRAAHNDIERKYRTNLKDRIAELRDAIPSLRAIPDDADDMATARAAPKVSKGTVLSKATEYIHQLERRNRSMAQKNEELARRLQAFEQLIGTGVVGANWQPQGFGAAVFNPRPFP
ncbi:putative helix-loop-helix dna-binding domain-containing protein [Eutypa lata UCREL1]|uniref:Putative helix-loop-helix dna-binding domain-containing protein n=1 Tax=Eutypa lata (strain UCR-EL1) TaxID=1287681 RepID=M7SWV6_EUTLA|nr:putative helix-loop-helix dna-binding domain-containing protein [Eutypa lata UCREL1]